MILVVDGTYFFMERTTTPLLMQVKSCFLIALGSDAKESVTMKWWAAALKISKVTLT